MADWGQTAIGDSVSQIPRIGATGMHPGGTLNAVRVYYTGTSGASESRRVGVFAGGTAESPLGATLIEDLGFIPRDGSSNVWLTATSATNPEIPEGRVWIIHDSTATSNAVSLDNEDGGDFDNAFRTHGVTSGDVGGEFPATVTEEWLTLGEQGSIGSYGYLSAYLDYTPLDGATTVSIDQSDPQQVEVGSTLQLSATVTNCDGATTWASDDEAVATVDASGLVSGVAVGSAEISATNNGVSDSITVGVVAAPAQAPTVTITSPAGNIAVTEGTTIVATATATDPVDGDLSASVEWTSSVDGALGTGASIQIVTDGWTEGNRTITATVENAAELEGSDDFVLTVGEAPEPPEPVARFDAARFAINAAGGIA